ncbi:MAG: (2Fe-2S)-binding protein [Elusimicrobia bacterium HGW-Elusimicrobia-1]|nr:MAG: (2Fe-2S)-binding protein [Elusimicrobia bacterium HGW-Elusimicrobia-1]
MKINFRLNGKAVSADCDPRNTLLEIIREDLRHTGTKEGCGKGECGACTVLFDGKPVTACIIPAAQAAGHDITTIEGLSGKNSKLHPIQQAFVEVGAVQCGFCIPGMVLSAKALLDENPRPDEAAIREALSGNLCRCTGYIKIFDAVKKAAAVMLPARRNKK